MASKKKRCKIITAIAWSIIVCGMLYSSCSAPAPEGFTSEELSWLVYRDNDTLVFTDEAGQVHRLYVRYHSDFSEGRRQYPLEAEVEIKSPELQEHFRIYLIKDKQDIRKFFMLNDVYRSFDLSRPLDSVRINGRVYQQVYVFREPSTTADSIVCEVYFSKQYGILRYYKCDRGYFDLVERSNPV
ncbi:MAG: hypothetical protein KatS3mg031_1410 [Chitinophagales bacterium]|nr:MAG: hypothetical protein KatS3mg031_1410 [Chitinophagales bacterium]